jgi:hypothetical protein
MPAKKGQNNFAAVQKRIVGENLAVLEARIREIKRGTVFASVNALVDYLSHRTGMHRTTLKRNPEYYKRILVCFGRQPGAAAWVDAENADAATLRAKLLDLQIELRGVRQENQALRRALTNFTQAAGSPQTASLDALGPVGSTDNPPRTAGVAKDVLAASQVAMCLLAVLERLAEKELGIVIDDKAREIHDLSEEGEKRVLVGSRRASMFFSWLQQNKLALELGGDHE